MSFVSFEFATLLTACWAAYALLRRGPQNLLLLAASYVFYGSWDWRFLGLLWLSTLTDYVAGRRMHAAHRVGNTRARRRWLLTSLVVNLGALGFFKYCDFFVVEAVALLQSIGLEASAPTLNIILPVGISFYTFQTLSYTVDIYRGELEPTDNFIEFATFVAFFPQLVAGPIERARHLLPQFARERTITVIDVREGVWLMLIGYTRKVVVADTAAHFVEPYFRDPGKHSSMGLAVGLLLFSLQIYGDFAGYSDIARGTARLFGFDLMRNFEHPYFASSVSDFWRRWHISLSTWLRDYLYVPLGGNRHGAWRTYRNLMTTMLLGGLWHGASWNFVIWGGLHGLYLCAHRPVRHLGGVMQRRFSPAVRIPLGISGGVLTFLLVTFTWLFFRSTSFDLTLVYLHGLAAMDFSDVRLLIPFLVLAALTLFIDLPQAVSGHEHTMARMPLLLRAPLAAAMIALMLMSPAESEPFIYFQF